MASFRFGSIDPTTSLDKESFWRATITPEGPATLRLLHSHTTPTWETFGPGANWLDARVPNYLGCDDHIPHIDPCHDAVRLAQRRFGNVRLGKSQSPYHELLPAVLGQRVTAGEAVRQWHAIVTQHGQRAPGPHLQLMTPPDPEQFVKIPYTTFHAYGIERKRADTLRQVAKHAHFLFRDWAADTEASEHTASLQHIPGVGPWTAAVAGSVAFGDPDAIAVGDFHLKNTIAWALHRRARGTDEEMIASLAPYLGQRQRVVRWLQLMGFRAPARGPKKPIRPITQL